MISESIPINCKHPMNCGFNRSAKRRQVPHRELHESPNAKIMCKVVPSDDGNSFHNASNESSFEAQPQRTSLLRKAKVVNPTNVYKEQAIDGRSRRMSHNEAPVITSTPKLYTRKSFLTNDEANPSNVSASVTNENSLAICNNNYGFSLCQKSNMKVTSHVERELWLSVNDIEAMSMNILRRFNRSPDVYVIAAGNFTEIPLLLRLHVHQSVIMARFPNYTEENILIFPFLSGEHWLMVIIAKLTKQTLYFDSLHNFYQPALIAALNVAQHICVNAVTFAKQNVHSLPHQNDAYNCGIYILEAIEIFVRNNCQLTTDFNFDNSDMVRLRSKFVGYEEDAQIGPEQLFERACQTNVDMDVHACPDIHSIRFPRSNTFMFTSLMSDKFKRDSTLNAEQIRRLNINIHRKIRKSLNSVTCTHCHKGFLNVKFRANSLECETCRNSKPLKYTADNDMDPGAQPDIFKTLTLAEKLILCKIQPCIFVIRLRYGQYAVKGHTIFFDQDLQHIATTLPRSKTKIVVVGKMRTDGKIIELKVRKHVVLHALQYLIEHNPYYSDIMINTEFIDSLSTETELLPDHIIEQDVSLSDDLDYVGDTAVIGADTLHSSAEILRKRLEKLQVIDFPAHSMSPVNEFNTPGLASMAFPWLFPTGKAEYFRGPNNYRRIDKVTFQQWCHHLFSQSDSRFRADLMFKFWCINFLQRLQILEAGRLVIRHVSELSNLDHTALLHMLKDNNFRRKRLDMFRQAVTGSQAYWYKERNYLESMFRQLGMPSHFVTLSSNDRYWHDLLALYKVTEHDELQYAVIKDPFPAVVYFHTKVNVFLKDFFAKHWHVYAYFVRFEIQHRGSMHAHIPMWSHDFPKRYNASHVKNEDLIKLIDERVSCVNPHFNHVDKLNSKDLVEKLCTLPAEKIDDVISHANLLLNGCCRHTRHGPHCLRSVGTHQQKECRYGYPKELRDATSLSIDSTDCLEVHYKRNDPSVIPHNKMLLAMWNANCDVQVIVSHKKLFAYLAKYVCKEEKPSDVLKCIENLLLQSNISTLSVIQRLFMQSCKRDVSAQEAAHLLMGYNLTSCNLRFKTVNTQDSAVILDSGKCAKNDLQRYCQLRPKELENVSMFEFYKNFLIYASGKIVALKQQQIVVPIPHYQDFSEQWYRQQCILHIPWRSIDRLNINRIPWSELYKQINPQCKYNELYFSDIDADETESLDEIGQFMPSNANLADDDQIHELLDALRKDNITYSDLCANLQFKHYENFDWRASSIDFTESDFESFDQELKSAANDTYFFDDIEFTLNAEQQQLFDRIINHHRTEDTTQLLLLVQAVGGTGKSYLLNSLQKALRNAQITTAFTGAACRTANGITIHSLFSIAVGAVKELSESGKLKLEKKFSNVKYLLVDEWSMISVELLGQIDDRLRCITQKSFPFGGINVVFFGDIHQLDPVDGNPIYYSGVCQREADLNGQKCFAYIKETAVLKTNMRQQNDSTFQKILLNVRYGICSNDDYMHLQSRFYAKPSLRDEQDMLYIFSTNEACDRQNLQHIQRMQSEMNPVAIITAEGKYKNAKKTGKLGLKVSSISQRLCLCKGSRVMLTHNISVRHGLVNGAIGVVTNIIYFNEKPPRLPDAVLVRFENYTGPTLRDGSVPIRPVAVSTKHHQIAHMTNLPLKLSYAITVHKSQGLTLKKCFLDIGKKELHLGQTYVGLSRVRKLEDLFLSYFPNNRIEAINKHARFQRRCEVERYICERDFLQQRPSSL